MPDGAVKRLLALVALLAATSATTAAAGPAPVPRLAHVVLIVFENRERSSVAGRSDAPHFNAYAYAYADLTNDDAVAHPSLPNYLALVSGSTQGITTDCTPCSAFGSSIGTLLTEQGRPWGGYAEGYPSSPFFAKKHMPFLYFDGQASHVYPLRDLRAASLPAFALVAPNLCNDGHDCSTATADRFLGRFLPPLLHVPRTAVFVLFDEGTSDAGGGGHIFAFVAGTAVKAHVLDSAPTNHYGVLRTIEDALGVGHLGQSAQARPLVGIWRRD